MLISKYAISSMTDPAYRCDDILRTCKIDGSSKISRDRCNATYIFRRAPKSLETDIGRLACTNRPRSPSTLESGEGESRGYVVNFAVLGPLEDGGGNARNERTRWLPNLWKPHSKVRPLKGKWERCSGHWQIKVMLVAFDLSRETSRSRDEHKMSPNPRRGPISFPSTRKR